MALHYASSLSRLDVSGERRPVFTRHRLSSRGGAKRRHQSYHRLRTSSRKHNTILNHQLTLWLAYISILNRSSGMKSSAALAKSRSQVSSLAPAKPITTQQPRGNLQSLRATFFLKPDFPSNMSKHSEIFTLDDETQEYSDSSISRPAQPNAQHSLLLTPSTPTKQDSSSVSSLLIASNGVQTPSTSSDVSSPPSELGPTPEGLSNLQHPEFSTKPHSEEQVSKGSPVRRSQRMKTAPIRFTNVQSEDHIKPTTKRRKLSHSATSSKSDISNCTSSSDEHLSKKQQQQQQQAQNSLNLLKQGQKLSPDHLSATGSSLKYSSHPSVAKGQNADHLPSQKLQASRELSSDNPAKFVIGGSFTRDEPLPKHQRLSKLERHQRVIERDVEDDIAHAFCAKSKNEEYVRQKNEEQLETFFSQFEKEFDAAAHNHEEWKDKTMYPMFDKENPVYYGADSITRYKGPPGVQHGSNHDSEAPSPPSRRGRGGGRGRGGFGGWRGRGRGRGGAGAGGGRERGESPDPPQKANLGPEDKLTLSHIRTRQAELKKFFGLVGAQQVEILNLLASRDLSKMVKKARAHTKVSEFDEICDDIDDLQNDARSLILQQLDFEQQLAENTHKREMEIVDSYFRTRVEEAQQEHIKGAEGDLIIFKNAHNAANDDTRTETGSDVDCYFPRYHECPEPDATVRGYSSTKIKDEKSLKQHLATYDEQAQREVIDDDVFGPLAKSVAYQNAERKKNEDKEKTQTIYELVNVAEDELKEIGGYLIPRPMYASENPQFALSRLADASEYMSRAHPEQSFIFMPVTSAEAPQVAKDIIRNDPPPSQLPPPPPPPPARNVVPPPPKRATAKKQRLGSDPSKRPVRPLEQQQNGASTPTSNLLPAIAPAPMRLPPPPPSPLYPPPPPPPSQHIPYSMPPPPPIVPPSPQNSRRSTSNFTFTPTQTPGHSYFAPSAPTRTYSNGTTPQGHNKMHNTFVNQTIESRLQADMARENAARTQGQGAGPKGGKRILLPKV